MQGRKDVSGFIQAFAGDNRYIVDYLAEEVLQRQPTRIQDFLVRTSVLDVLSGPLCDAVSRREDSQAILDELPALLDDLRRRNNKVILTNGCFDLIHVGHIQLVSAAKELGDFLIVAIDDDASVRQVKGPGRPVIAAEERIRILSALDSVDAVVVFASEELEDLIDLVKPDVLAKGSNYQSAEVRGHEHVARHGGRVALVPISEDVSATRIIDHIRNGK